MKNNQEQLRVVSCRIKTSRKLIAELKDSASHVSSVIESCQEMELYLEEVEKEVAQEAEKTKIVKKTFTFLYLLFSWIPFLSEFLEKAKSLLEAIGWRN